MEFDLLETRRPARGDGVLRSVVVEVLFGGRELSGSDETKLTVLFLFVL